MIRYVLVLLCCLVSFAQMPEDDLVPEDTAVLTRTDAFGQESLVIEGELVNRGTMAYTSILLFAEAYNASDELVAEGFGFPVTACGAALLPDFALQPGQRQRFSIPIELFDDTAEIAYYVVMRDGTTATPAGEPQDVIALLDWIKPVTRQEVVSVEWIDDETLRYGVGCVRDLFTTYTWYDYSVASGESRETVHPKAALLTEKALELVGLNDPVKLSHSMLSFSPYAGRFVYQNDLNSIYTAEPDGTYARILYDRLSNRSLQGFIWLPEGRFLAYYFGAYGEPVLYFTATLNSETISAPISRAVPSVIIPGPLPLGQTAVIGGTFEQGTGYYLKSVVTQNIEFLFASELPGNNWPPPLYFTRDGSRPFIYIARLVQDAARLQCFDLTARTLHDLTPLPLDLSSEDRAWWWLSPDQRTLALAENGPNGGLWLIDVSRFSACR